MPQVPSTIIKLLANVPLDNLYRDTITFSTPSEQYNYFNSKALFSSADFTYIRTSGRVRVPYLADRLYGCNYMMFQNANYGAKWFYAFITDVLYVNEVTTELTFEIDVMQTWAFDYIIGPSLVEREHVADDTVGLHTLPEPVSVDDYKVSQTVRAGLTDNLYSVIVTTMNGSAQENITMYDGLYSGAAYYAFTADEILEAAQFFEKIVTAGRADAIIAIGLLPDWMVVRDSTKKLVPTNAPRTKTVTAPSIPSTLDGYIPRNLKLYTYPYTYLYGYSTSGGSAVYKYELMNSTFGYNFTIYGQISPDPSFLAVYPYYAGSSSSYDVSLTLSGFPNGSWVTDVYTNYLMGHRISTIMGAASAIGRPLNDALSGGGVNPSSPVSIATSARGALNNVGQAAWNAVSFGVKMKEDLNIPPQLRGALNASGLATLTKTADIYFCSRTVKAEIAQEIDSFFDVFGYYVNEVKTPNINSRRYWNYLKTRKANITGPISYQDIASIRAILDNGITFWHTTNVGDYSLDNSTGQQPPNPPTPPDPPPAETWAAPFANWKANITSEWGPRVNPVTGEQEFHNGIDIAMPLGTPIAACAAGQVGTAGWQNERGNYIKVSMSAISNSWYIYQHLQTYNVSSGQTLSVGEANIANVGATGQVTGPHLHLEIWINGQSVNPRLYLP